MELSPTNGRQTDSEDRFNIQPEKTTKYLRWRDHHAIPED
jgi:hypothetical protein